MAIKVKVGEVYDCPDMRSGVSDKGEWAFFRVKAKKGTDSVIVWSSNASAVKNAKAVKILRIDEVNLKARLDERSGKWYKDYSVTAKMELAAGRQGAGTSQTPEEFMAANEADLNALFGL